MTRSDSSTTIREVLAAGPVLPVVVLERAADAVPLARALLAGGVRTMEVTLRTPCALEGIGAITREVPGMTVGAGTLLDVDDLNAARAAGAAFGVSPGATQALLREVRGWPFLPGASTPSEVMTALDAGYATLKFFPAAFAGGVAMLRALAGPFPDVRFCPTGGIDPATAAEYLALSNVACVGGTWLASRALLDAGDWDGVTRLAAQAAVLRSPGPPGVDAA